MSKGSERVRAGRLNMNARHLRTRLYRMGSTGEAGWCACQNGELKLQPRSAGTPTRVFFRKSGKQKAYALRDS